MKKKTARIALAKVPTGAIVVAKPHAREEFGALVMGKKPAVV